MISHSNKNGKIYLHYNDDLLGVLSEKVLRSFLSKDEKKEEKKVEKNIRKVTTTKQVDSFIKYYLMQKDKFYGKKLPKNITSNSKDYKYFKQAIEVAKDLDMPLKRYIKAQIQGLSFVNSGRGQFPRPVQLVGDNALQRALDFLRETEVDEDEIVLSNVDTWKPLSENDKYQLVKKKIANQTASLSEAYYAKKVEEHWNDKAYMETEVYIEIMEEDVSS